MTKLIVAFCNFAITLKNFVVQKLNESLQNIEYFHAMYGSIVVVAW